MGVIYPPRLLSANEFSIELNLSISLFSFIIYTPTACINLLNLTKSYSVYNIHVHAYTCSCLTRFGISNIKLLGRNTLPKLETASITCTLLYLSERLTMTPNMPSFHVAVR